jgi:hypothetical protein
MNRNKSMTMVLSSIPTRNRPVRKGYTRPESGQGQQLRIIQRRRRIGRDSHSKRKLTPPTEDKNKRLM